ncbi:MAG TPA: methylenetetrahydrofolate reductase C-terminal domain-containing protein [Planctomycetota bacterium]|nr:methylenetetrahydrofolate reductase C-terminal domain-containing protein [Planctomycetota bacterium]
MNASERKADKEILESLADAKKVFIAACIGCPVGCDVGGQPWIDAMTAALEGAGHTVTGTCMVELMCNKALVGVKLGRFKDQVLSSDAVLVGSCGVGVQAAGNMMAVRAVPAMDTICLGDYQGLWPGEERCAECGECVLAWTGGLCPMTLCAKSLVNGQCGGTGDDGECEVSKDHPCGWKKIYDRLKELGRLDDMRRMVDPRDYRKRKVTDARRRTMRFALEIDEQAEAVATEEAE